MKFRNIPYSVSAPDEQNNIHHFSKFLVLFFDNSSREVILIQGNKKGAVGADTDQSLKFCWSAMKECNF